MGISGNLKTMELSELLQWLSQGMKSGTLVIDNGNVEKKIFFEKGIIISSASTDPNEYLGHFLVTYGHVQRELVDQALEKQQSENNLLGQILVNLGALTEEQLGELLHMKAEESIYDIFTWESADFRFFDGELPQKTMIPMRLDVQWIILEGSRRVDEWKRIRSIIPSPHAVPVSIVDLSEVETDEATLRILGLINDDRTVGEICQELNSNLLHISKILAAFTESGHLKMVRPRVIEIEVPTDPPAQPAEVATPASAEPAPAAPAEVAPATPAEAAPAAAAPAPEVTTPAPSGMQVAGRTLNFAVAADTPAAAPEAPAPASAPPQISESDRLLGEAEGYLAANDLRQALASYRQAESVANGDPSIAQKVKLGEEKIRKALERDGVRPSSVPKLKCGIEDLTQLDITHHEGFMLTRVDGNFDLASILKISPLPKLEAQLLFWYLKKSGHLTFS